MRKALVLAAAASAGLALTGSALAAYAPRLVVQGSDRLVVGGGPLTISVSQDQNDDATARVVIYAPLGYRVTLGQAVGAKLGTVSAQVIAKALGGALLPLAGDVVVDDPAKYASNPCAPGTHEAVWNLVLTAAGQTLQVPLYVDRVTAAPENTFASLKIVVCLPSPDVPPDQGGATFGAKLIKATFGVAGVFSNPVPAGNYVFRSVWTPYATNSGTVNAAGTVEARAAVPLPVQNAMSAVVNRRTGVVTIRGSVTENRVAVAGATVRLYFGATARGVKVFRTVRTNARGNYAATIRIKKGVTRFLRSFAIAPARDDRANGCAGTSLAPAGCVNATIEGFGVYNRSVIRIRR